MATLGSQAVGSTVKLNVNGTARNFIVVHQGLPGSMYDASCDGTWLLMEDVYEKRKWDSSDNDYANSDVHSYLNNTFVNLFDADIKSVIKQVKLPYTQGTGSEGSLKTGSNGLSSKVFLLSYPEVGFGESLYANSEGAVLSYFNGAAKSKRVAYLNGSATIWWLRSPYIKDEYRVQYVYSDGTSNGNFFSSSYGVRPALVLPYDVNVAGDGTIVLATGAITGSVNIGGVQRELTGEGYINIGGVLRELSDSQVNIGGILKSLKG
jgi:hypothetical protein